MTTEQAKTLSENAITRLMEALERGQSDALKTYLSAMSRFHKYSWGNCLLSIANDPMPRTWRASTLGSGSAVLSARVRRVS